MENATATIVPSALFLTLKGKRITRATFKSFVTKNRTNLLIKVTSKFDGMQDMVDSTGEKDFVPVRERDSNADNTLGIQGVWLVGGGRDYFTAFEEQGVTGIEGYNCCGSFRIGIKTGA